MTLPEALERDCASDAGYRWATQYTVNDWSQQVVVMQYPDGKLLPALWIYKGKTKCKRYGEVPDVLPIGEDDPRLLAVQSWRPFNPSPDDFYVDGQQAVLIEFD